MKPTLGRLTSRVLIAAILSCLVIGNYVGLAAEVSQRRRPPSVALIYRGDVLQRARPYTFCWGYTTSDGGTGMCADGWTDYPEAADVEAGSRLRLRIGYPHKPGRWFIEAHRAIVEEDGRDEAIGPSEEIPFRLKPHRVGGVVKAWDFIFRLEEPLRHYYLNTGGRLRQGDAFYALHVQT